MQDKKRPFLAGFLIIGLLLVTALVMSEGTQPRTTDVDFSTFSGMVDSGKLSQVTISGNDVVGKGVGKDVGKSYHAVANAPAVQILLHKMEEKKTPYRIDPPPADNSWLSTMLMFGAGIFIFYLVLGSVAGRQGKQIEKITGSGVKFHNPTEKTTFADVAGSDEAVEQCHEFVAFLKEPKKFQKLGGRAPKGILLTGPSGTGKTLLARAVAGEAGVPFLHMSGSDFVEMFVGVGAKRVRDLFATARKNAPCILFIDEIDAVGQKRGQGMSGGGHDEREQTLNAILVEMDGFEANIGVMIMAATNRPEVLDKALKRKGRFDREVVMDKPDVKGREAILKVHVKKVLLAPDVDLSIVARGTPGFTGADLEGLINEAALQAGKAGKEAIGNDDLEAARDLAIMGGKERKTAIITEQVKQIIAGHEAGHTVVGWFEEDADPVHKVSIIPRGQALGVTMYLPETDQLLYTKEQLVSRIRTALGGRIAEKILFGRVTTGASNDLQVATGIAKSIVTDYGMTDAGLRTFGQRQVGFLGIEQGARDYSESTARKIDHEVNRLLRESYTYVENLLTEKRTLLDAVTAALREHETLNAAQLTAILGPPVFRTA